MADYKSMYFKAMAAMESAINILIEAQQTCEEEYISANDMPISIAELNNKEE